MKKFLADTADVLIFSTDDQLIGIATTTSDASISTSVENTEIRGGKGNALQYSFHHSSSFTGQLTDTQWNLAFVEQTLGAEALTTAGVLYKQETESTILPAGTVVSGHNFKADLYGDFVWAIIDEKPYTFKVDRVNQGVYDIDLGNHAGLEGKKVCFKYAVQETGANIKTLKINSNFVPKVVKLVLDADLYSSEGKKEQQNTKIGSILITVPRAQLDGSLELTLTAGGVSSTPLGYSALSHESAIENSCETQGVYAYITEIIHDMPWDEGVTEIAIDGGDRAVEDGDQIRTYAITGSKAFIVTPADRLDYYVEATKIDTDNQVAQGLSVFGVITDASKFATEKEITVKLGNLEDTIKITEKP